MQCLWRDTWSVWYTRSLLLVPCHGDRSVWKGSGGCSKSTCGFLGVQDYPSTDVCQILQKAKELQDMK